MEEKELSKAQEAIVKSIHNCIRKFEKIEKKLLQPWRNSSAATKDVHKRIMDLNEILPKVGKSTNVQVRMLVSIMRTMALLMETELDHQDMQKAIGEDVSPFHKSRT